MQPVVEPTEEVEDIETNPPWTRTDGKHGPTESQDDELYSEQMGANRCGSQPSAGSSTGSGDGSGNESGSAISLEEDNTPSPTNAVGTACLTPPPAVVNRTVVGGQDGFGRESCSGSEQLTESSTRYTD